jgi:uncharacterized membrane protein HdeD (DUF308 family)
MTGTIPSEGPEQPDYSSILLFFGIALLILGAVAMICSVFVTLGTVLILGVLLLVAGVAEFIHVFRSWHEKRAFLNVLSGIAYLITGGLTLYNPIAGALSFTLVITAFLLAAGIIRCFHALNHRNERMWVWFLIGGIVDLILAAMIAIGWPATGLQFIGLFVGIEMLIHGAAWIALSTMVKDTEKV